jgi:hypothetical protein
MLALYIVPVRVGGWVAVPIFILILIEEALGRWQFYEHLQQRVL